MANKNRRARRAAHKARREAKRAGGMYAGETRKLPLNPVETNYSGIRPSDVSESEIAEATVNLNTGASVYNEKTGYFEPAPNPPGKAPALLQHGAQRLTEWFKGKEAATPSTGTTTADTSGHTATRYVCTHPALSPVAQLSNNCRLFIGAGFDVRDYRRFKLIIDCADVVDEYGGHRFPKGYENLSEFCLTMPPVIKLGWRDYAAPALRFQFWEKLYESLPDGDILLCCVGGHGRSGTALAAILIIAWNITAAKAIQTVRAHHCDSAIETAGQREYLIQLSKWWAKECGKAPDDDVVKVADTEPGPKTQGKPEPEPIDDTGASFDMIEYLGREGCF